jgi:hypothetical protein
LRNSKASPGRARPAEQATRFADPVDAQRGFGLFEQRVGVHIVLVARSAANV